ncbi:MAG TPA: molybdate ABC transporter substrate-binding protein [Steroidobacteraceae bacterium]|nr:molybdate ABC transporter substrate-binding protein [Steroidobacteraceae bacterium]
MNKNARLGMTLWLLLLCLPGSAAPSDKPTIIVFAAASLTNALQQVGDDFSKDSSSAAKFSFAASSALARQIESGAPADVFFSADLRWMDYLQARKLIQVATRRAVLGNHLVLVAPVNSRITLHIAPRFPLLAALRGGRLAIGDPDGVPAGRYAHEALDELGVWSAVANHLARAESVRSALALVDRGEAPLGIVYQTDALIDNDVRVVDVFPDATHAPITYPIALVSGAHPDAAQFLHYVESPAAAAVFKRYGFVPLH